MVHLIRVVVTLLSTNGQVILNVLFSFGVPVFSVVYMRLIGGEFRIRLAANTSFLFIFSVSDLRLTQAILRMDGQVAATFLCPVRVRFGGCVVQACVVWRRIMGRLVSSFARFGDVIVMARYSTNNYHLMTGNVRVITVRLRVIRDHLINGQRPQLGRMFSAWFVINVSDLVPPARRFDFFFLYRDLSWIDTHAFRTRVVRRLLRLDEDRAVSLTVIVTDYFGVLVTRFQDHFRCLLSSFFFCGISWEV